VSDQPDTPVAQAVPEEWMYFASPNPLVHDREDTDAVVYFGSKQKMKAMFDEALLEDIPDAVVHVLAPVVRKAETVWEVANQSYTDIE
jgi:hypothetical protein